MKPRQAKTEN